MPKGRKTGGRAKGTPNKINGQVREMILAALDGVGGKDYLVTQALLNPSAFLQLLGKALPLHMSSDPGEQSIVSQTVRRVIIDPKDAS